MLGVKSDTSDKNVNSSQPQQQVHQNRVADEVDDAHQLVKRGLFLVQFRSSSLNLCWIYYIV